MTLFHVKSKLSFYGDHSITLVYTRYITSASRLAAEASLKNRVKHAFKVCQLLGQRSYENTWKCGELKLYFSPSAGGRKKKKKKGLGSVAA